MLPLSHSSNTCERLQLSLISAVQLDDESVDTIKELSSLCRDFRQGTTSVARIQRGSPRANTLTIPVANFTSKFSSLADRCRQIFIKDSQVPGIKILENRLSELIEVLREPFSDAGNDTGYSERVKVLEKCNYVNGILQGVVEVIIRHHEHWKCTLAGQPPLARRLNFDDTSSTSSIAAAKSLSGQSEALNPQTTMAGSLIITNSHGNPGFVWSVAQTSQQPTSAPHLPRIAVTANSSLPHAGGSLFSYSQPSTTTKPTKKHGQPVLQGGLCFGGGHQLGSGLQLGQQPLGQQSNGSFNPFASLPTTVSTMTTSSQDLSPGACVSSSTFPKQVGVKFKTASDNTQAPQREQDRQKGLYIPKQAKCTQERRSKDHKAATLISQGSVPDSITVNIDEMVHMCGRITKLWEAKQHTDVTLIIQGSHIPAHRIILASQSKYFDRLLFGNMREASQQEIRLNDVKNLQAFQLLMQYIYSGCMKIQKGNIQDVLDVLKLSDQFGLEPLKNAVGEKLTDVMNTHNVLQLLSYDDMYQVTRLLEHCCAFIDGHAGNVLCSDDIASISDHALTQILSRDSLCVPEIQIFHTVLQWKENNNDVTDEAMKRVLSCVRLSEIPPKVLLDDIVASSLFKQESIMLALKAQIMPDFERMKPRGTKCAGLNLMNNTQVELCQVLFTGTGEMQLIKSCMNNGVVKLDPPQPAFSFGWNLPQHGSQCSCVQVTLKQEYLLNTIELEGTNSQPLKNNNIMCIPPITDDEVPMLNTSSQNFRAASPLHQKRFSYIIQISKNGQDWQKLFDYSQHCCHKTQRLCFPPSAFRYFQFQLKNGYQQLDLKVTNCSFIEDNKRFKFRANGVIAPLFPLKPLAHQMRGPSPEKLVVEFNQPYSVSMLSFRICGPADSQADFKVGFNNISIIHRNIWQSLFTPKTAIGHVKGHPFNEEFSVEFDEQVITGITVEVTNIQKNVNTKSILTTPCTARQVAINTLSSLVSFNSSAPVESSFTTGSEAKKVSAPPTSNSNVNKQATASKSDSPGVHSDYVYRVAGLTCQAKVN